jgi:hypothetical protein
MNILDETVGSLNWKRSHQLINNNLFCEVSIYDKDKKEWVSKQDVGVESFTEKVKGQASDGFKRSCFNWGIGRELYTSPFIWISLNSSETYKYKTSVKLDKKVKFEVSHIKTVDGMIVELSIKDQNNKQRFNWIKKQPLDPVKVKALYTLDPAKVKALYTLATKKGLNGADVKKGIKTHYNATSTKDLTLSQFNDTMKRLKKLEDKKAEVK